MTEKSSGFSYSHNSHYFVTAQSTPPPNEHTCGFQKNWGENRGAARTPPPRSPTAWGWLAPLVGAPLPMDELAARMALIKHVVLVLSGKGVPCPPPPGRDGFSFSLLVCSAKPLIRTRPPPTNRFLSEGSIASKHPADQKKSGTDFSVRDIA